MDTTYWEKHSELHRKAADQPPGIDVPIRTPTEKIAEGNLGDMLDQWSAFSAEDRANHIILLGGGSLTDSTMAALSEKRRSGEG